MTELVCNCGEPVEWIDRYCQECWEEYCSSGFWSFVNGMALTVGVKTCMSCDTLVLAGHEGGDLCEECLKSEDVGDSSVSGIYCEGRYTQALQVLKEDSYPRGLLVPSWEKALEGAIASTPDWEELPL